MPRCGVRLCCWRIRQKLCGCCPRKARDVGGFEDPVDDWEADGTGGAEFHMNRLSAARRKYEQAIEKRTTHAQPSSDDNAGLAPLTAKFRLAGVVDDMGDWHEARRLYEEVVAERQGKLGSLSADTLDAQWLLAMLLIDDPSEWAESRQLWGAVTRGYSHAHGKLHPNTLAAGCCLFCCCVCTPLSCCRGGGCSCRRGAGGRGDRPYTLQEELMDCGDSNGVIAP